MGSYCIALVTILYMHASDGPILLVKCYMCMVSEEKAAMNTQEVHYMYRL